MVQGKGPLLGGVELEEIAEGPQLRPVFLAGHAVEVSEVMERSREPLLTAPLPGLCVHDKIGYRA